MKIRKVTAKAQWQYKTFDGKKVEWNNTGDEILLEGSIGSYFATFKLPSGAKAKRKIFFNRSQSRDIPKSIFIGIGFMVCGFWEDRILFTDIKEI